MQRILAATDGSRGGDRAVIAAAQLAKATGATLSFVTIGGNISAAELRQLARSEGGAGEALELITNQALDQARLRAKRLGISKVKVHVGWGDPAGCE